LILNHESWRDEAQAWLISRDSPSISSVLGMMGYEGTPALWHIILYPLVKMNLPYLSMNIIHFLVAFTAVILFLLFAPFTKVQKILFVFGYYIFYEYNIIARNYVFLALFLFIIAAFYKERFKKPFLYAILIFLLANSNTQGFIIGIILGFIYIVESRLAKNINFTAAYVLAVILIVIGYIVVLFQIATPSDLSWWFRRWNLSFNLDHASQLGKILINAFFPIPKLQIDFWNTTIINGPPIFLNVIGVILYLLSAGFFLRKPKSMIIYLLFSGSLIGLILLKCGAIYSRHSGTIFVAFIFSLWLANNEPEKQFIKNSILNYVFNPKALSRMLTILLAIQVIASIIALNYEIKYDFSSGKKAAKFLDENKFTGNDTFIITYHSYATSSILPYLEAPNNKFYCIEYQGPASFMVWNSYYDLSCNLTVKQIIERVDEAILDKNYRNILIILNLNAGTGFAVMNPMTQSGKTPTERYRYELIAKFENTIVPDESLYIYRINR
jgi:hypothetical protein